MVSEETKQKISQVAETCIRCRKCMKECIMLNRFAQNPKALFTQYLEEGPDNMDPQIAYSCNECSQCTLKCPKGLNLKAVFQSLKADYATENGGTVPLETLLSSELRQVKECSPEYCTTISGSAKKNTAGKPHTKYVFVPGCSVPAYAPHVVENVLQHLKECLGDENVGAMLQCCGKVSEFMGEVDKFHERNKLAIDKLDEMGAEVIITICPSCYKVFKETARNQRVISYWELMHNLIGVPNCSKGVGKGSDVTFNIHDSCVTRDEPSHHESIRWILDEMGYQWKEIERNRCNTRCCGVGGMVCTSDSNLYEQVYTRRKGDFTQNNIVSYCGSCRNTFEAADLDSLHILDLMFAKSTYTLDQAKKRGYESAEQMWENRLETKNRLNRF